MTSCALCRKSHTLDPDVLRAQFDQQRVANLSWRLGQTRATRAFSKPSWEAAAAGHAHAHGFASPLARTKEMLLASSAAVGGGGGWAAAAEAEADDVKKLAKSASVFPRGDEHEGPDIGALPRSRLLRRARSSVKRALLNRDAGGMTPAELRSRWVRLMGSGHREQAHAAVLPPDCGAAPVAVLGALWAALLAPTAAGSPLDVGAAVPEEVAGRVAGLRPLSVDEAPECGAAPLAVLGMRWAALAGQFVAPAEVDVGGASLAALRAAWESTARVGAIGRDVGALATAELTTSATYALAPECGAASVEALTARLRSAAGAAPVAGSEDVGGLARLPLPSTAAAVAAAVASALPAECGALLPPALAGRWAALLSAAGVSGMAAGDADVGALSAAGLAGRWGVMWAEAVAAGGEDAGASSVAETGGRWSGLLRAAGGAGGDVGGCGVGGMEARWRAALKA